MREPLLTRHFLWRFLEHDFISSGADRHGVLSVVAGSLVGVSLFAAVLVATPYQFSPDMPPGTVSLNSLDDRFLFMSASMLLMALAALAQWDALALDARDTAVLCVLPVPRVMIARAKFTAVAVFAVGAAVLWNLPPTLLRFAAVPSKLGIGVRDALVLTLAHGATTFAAGMFGFVAVLGVREVMSAILGRAQFQRISPAVQAALIVAVVTALLLLPAAFASGVARHWLAQADLRSTALPPLWFVGLHETLAGSVIDTLPRTHPSWFPPPLVLAERSATDLYRGSWPRYHELASLATAALLICGVLTTAAWVWNSRRLPLPLGRRPHDDRVAVRALIWLATHVVVRTPLRQAGFFFTLQTLSRQVSHRVALASSWAVGLSLILVTARGDLTLLPSAFLAGQSLLLASVLGGFRQAARIPAELRASGTFGLATAAGARVPYIAGVKLAGWIAFALPTLGGLFVWHTTLLGVRLAALHLGIGVVVSVLLTEALFARCRLVPFVSAYAPNGEQGSGRALFAAVVLLCSFALARVERAALESPAGYLMLVTIMTALIAGVRAFDRASQRSADLVIPDEPFFFTTQRLNLAE
jgi:hypothetical protein